MKNLRFAVFALLLTAALAAAVGTLVAQTPAPTPAPEPRERSRVMRLLDGRGEDLSTEEL
jgi:hypothetical protein